MFAGWCSPELTDQNTAASWSPESCGSPAGSSWSLILPLRSQRSPNRERRDKRRASTAAYDPTWSWALLQSARPWCRRSTRKDRQTNVGLLRFNASFSAAGCEFIKILVDSCFQSQKRHSLFLQLQLWTVANYKELPSFSLLLDASGPPVTFLFTNISKSAEHMSRASFLYLGGDEVVKGVDQS